MRLLCRSKLWPHLHARRRLTPSRCERLRPKGWAGPRSLVVLALARPASIGCSTVQLTETETLELTVDLGKGGSRRSRSFVGPCRTGAGVTVHPEMARFLRYCFCTAQLENGQDGPTGPPQFWLHTAFSQYPLA